VSFYAEDVVLFLHPVADDIVRERCIIKSYMIVLPWGRYIYRYIYTYIYIYTGSPLGKLRGGGSGVGKP
jgi:hypothetical protein